jgi:hypothetical protein
MSAVRKKCIGVWRKSHTPVSEQVLIDVSGEGGWENRPFFIGNGCGRLSKPPVEAETEIISAYHERRISLLAVLRFFACQLPEEKLGG